MARPAVPKRATDGHHGVDGREHHADVRHLSSLSGTTPRVGRADGVISLSIEDRRSVGTGSARSASSARSAPRRRTSAPQKTWVSPRHRLSAGERMHFARFVMHRRAPHRTGVCKNGTAPPALARATGTINLRRSAAPPSTRSLTLVGKVAVDARLSERNARTEHEHRARYAPSRASTSDSLTTPTRRDELVVRLHGELADHGLLSTRRGVRSSRLVRHSERTRRWRRSTTEPRRSRDRRSRT